METEESEQNSPNSKGSSEDRGMLDISSVEGASTYLHASNEEEKQVRILPELIKQELGQKTVKTIFRCAYFISLKQHLSRLVIYDDFAVFLLISEVSIAGSWNTIVNPAFPALRRGAVYGIWDSIKVFLDSNPRLTFTDTVTQVGTGTHSS